MTIKNPYYRIVDLLRETIESNKIKEGEPLPSEKKLMEQTGLGRSTVRKGLQVLIHEGLIYPIQGKGYYVNPRKNSEFRLFFNETGAIETSAEKIDIINVDIVKPSEQLSKDLQLTPNRKVVIIKRLIKSGETRIALDYKYIPFSAKSPIVEKELYNVTFPQMFTKEKALFDIKRKIKIYVSKTDEEMVKTLRTKIGCPVVCIEQILLDEDQSPIGIGVTKFLGEHFKVKAVSD